MQHTVFYGSGSRLARLYTGTAANAVFRIHHQLRLDRESFRIMAPFARHIASFEKYRGAYSRPILQRKSFNFCDNTFHFLFPFLWDFCATQTGETPPLRRRLPAALDTRDTAISSAAAPYSIITSSSCLGLPAQFLEGNLSSQPGRLVKGLDHGHHIHNLILLDRIFLYGHFSVEHLQNVVHFVNMSGKI